MRISWRKWNRILHRDIGYLIFGMTLIYALSGIALNHMKDWNPSYIVSTKYVAWDQSNSEHIAKSNVLEFLDTIGEKSNYKKYYFPEPGRLKIFLKNGSIAVDLSNGRGFMEKLQRRPILFEVNFLHYNPRRMWTYFSDVFSAGLILVAITGLFVIKGKKGITGRGAWLTGIGVLIPLVMLLFYLN